MTVTLGLIDQWLARGRRYRHARQWQRAATEYARLADSAVLTAEQSAEVQTHLGEAWLRQRRFGRARRHLRQALRHRPNDARCLFLLGLASGSDPTVAPGRALACYRRALAVAPRQPRCLSEAGLLLVRLGRADEGLTLLRQAVEIRPEDAATVTRLARGLSQAGRHAEAMAAVRAARFRAPHCGRLRTMWAELRTADLLRRQALAAARRPDDGPVLLPFLRPVAAEAARADGPAGLAGPHRVVRLRGRLGRRRVR